MQNCHVARTVIDCLPAELTLQMSPSLHLLLLVARPALAQLQNHWYDHQVRAPEGGKCASNNLLMLWMCKIGKRKAVPLLSSIKQLRDALSLRGNDEHYKRAPALCDGGNFCQLSCSWLLVLKHWFELLLLKHLFESTQQEGSIPAERRVTLV